ncbi:unnamed protein product, partial [Iphiclides podalirius]
MLKLTTIVNNVCKRACGGSISTGVRESHVWTSENIVKSPFKDIEIPNSTFVEHVWKNLDKWPTKTATVCGITGRQYTYEQIYRQSQVLGAVLRKKFRIENGDAVAIMLPNLPEYPTAIFGILNAGGLVTTLNPNYTAYEVQRQINMSHTKLIIAYSEIVPTVKQALQLCKTKIPIIAINSENPLPEGTVSYKEIIEDEHVDLNILREVERTADDVAFLPYSSGTTGLPKGVELTNYNIVANVEQQNTEIKQYADTTVVVLFLGSHPQVQTKHFEHLRCVTSGAAPLPIADIERFLEKVNPNSHFCQAYGLTETAPLATASPLGYKEYSKVGFGIPNIELRIIDGNLNNRGPNEVGELLIKGPNVMKGYKDNEEANKQVFLDDGWLRTGDMAAIDELGAVTISDRLKELIKVNAFQVPPAELESVCKEHPAVIDAAVVPIPDSKTEPFMRESDSTLVTPEGLWMRSVQAIRRPDWRSGVEHLVLGPEGVGSIPTTGKIL